MKKIFFAAIGLGLVAAFFWWAPRGPSNRAQRGADPLLTAAAPALTLPPPASPVPTAPALAPAKQPAPADSSLNAESRLAVRECLGEELGDWPSLAKALEKAAAGGRRALQWRVIQTEEEGRETRVRLAREPRESGAEALTVQIYTVDEDGLPDPRPPRPGQRENPAGWLSEYLRGKTVQQDARLEEITLPDGRSVSVETEGAELLEAQFHGPGRLLACSRKQEGARCRCR